MAVIQQTKYGTWRVRGRINHQWHSKTFPTKRECKEWWDALEDKLKGVTNLTDSRKTFLDALMRYAEEVTPTKSACRSESSNRP